MKAGEKHLVPTLYMSIGWLYHVCCMQYGRASVSHHCQNLIYARQNSNKKAVDIIKALVIISFI